MTSEELQRHLTEPYEREGWLKIVREVLPAAQPYAVAQPLSVEGTRAKAIWQLGEIQLADGRRIALLEMETMPGVDLARNRAGLRQIAARFIDLARYHAVLATFRDTMATSAEGVWRLTFALREASIDLDGSLALRETAPKRFTYVLGPSEPCRTPTERLTELAKHGRNAELRHVEEAFSVETLNKEFFRNFKTLFDALAAELRDNFKDWKKPVDAGERDPAAQEAQMLLNRLLFLSFVQRKGWLNRDQRYLSRHFNEYYASRKDDSYYREFLSRIFEIVSTEWISRDKVTAHLSSQDPRNHDLPFLNGGLFQDDDANDAETRRRRNLRISNATFARLFSELFDVYNFTIREDSPLDIEVAVDPEMLGKIFEELILSEELGAAGKSRRHDTGSHYTPRPVVHYLCREALAAWLEKRAPFSGTNDAVTRIRSLLALDASEGVDDAIMTRLRDLFPSPDEADLLLKELGKLRACDPAVGSGAFPMGLLYELLNLAHLTTARTRGKDPLDSDPDWAYDTRKTLILSALYGVDVQPVPVEICKLRLWLSLLVDHEIRVRPLDCTRQEFQTALKRLDPLPNLDFKIRRADSLVDTIHGQRIEIQRLSGDPNSRKPLSDLASAKRDYFIADSKTKKRELRLMIANAYSELAQIELTWQRNEQGLALDDGSASAGRAARLKDILDELGRFRIRMKGAQRKLNVSDQDRLLSEIDDFFDKPDAPTFVWRLDFAEVFVSPDPRRGDDLLTPENPTSKQTPFIGGFGIVLANPPFVRQERIRALKPMLKERFTCFTSTADLYVYFYELGISILADNGALAYISSNSVLNSGFGRSLRKFFRENTCLRRVVDFAETKIFGATVESCIIVTTRGYCGGNNVRALKWNEERKAEDIETAVERDGLSLSQDELDDTGWRLESGETIAILSRMKSGAPPLSKFIGDRFMRGILTGLNDAFYVNEAERADLVSRHKGCESILRPFLRGRDIERWRINFAEQYLILIESSENRKHPWSGHSETKAEQIFRDTYPSIYDRFRPHRDALRSRQDKGTYWWELRSCSYWDEFQRPKIVYQEINRTDAFALDTQGRYINNKLFMLPDQGPFLLSLFNSRLGRWFIHTYSGVPFGGFLALQWPIMAEFPVPTVTQGRRTALEQIANYVLYLHEQPSVKLPDSKWPRDPLAAQYFERWIDALVYQLFFSQELMTAALDFFRLHKEATLPELESIPGPKRMPELRAIYEKLSHPDHALRGALLTLDSLPFVKMMEGRS
jgi:adenine-specific DNA-methyltransferase